MAEKILETYRIQMRDGLTAPVIKNLVDDLREKNVLSAEESENILHLTNTRTDQARDLIDAVRRKGSKASEILLKCLKEKDKFFYDTLKIHQEIPETPASSITTDKPNSMNDEYKMDSNPRGLCLIINNEIFKNPERNRNGSQGDVDSLKAVFEYLGFLVEIKTDQTGSDMKQLMTDYSKDHRHGDCFVCCVMSHGNETGVEGCDGQICPHECIISPFNGNNCPSLKGKPKVFFIQACRGHDMQSKVVVADGLFSSSKQPSKYSIAQDSDFLIAMSTVQGFVAIRHPISGSWFIQTLCKHLREGSKRGKDILGILTTVNDEVSRKEGFLEENDKIIEAKTTPHPSFTLRKSLVFRVPKGK